MKDSSVRHVILVREAMLDILRSGRRMKQGELATAVAAKNLHFGKRLCADSIYGLVGLAVRIYESEFYRDPSDGAISLSLTRLQFFRKQDASKANAAKRMGTTASGRIHDAIEATEG
jgi:hypothetical protein